MSDPWKSIVTVSGEKPLGVTVAQVVCGLVGVGAGAYACLASMVIVAFEQDSPEVDWSGWALVGFTVLLGICSLAALVGFSGRERWGWWPGLLCGVLVAGGGAAWIHAAVRGHQSDLVPELFWGLAVLAVGGVLLAVLLAPGTRQWVREGPSRMRSPSAGDGTWRVAEPGVDLRSGMGGDPVEYLAAGTVVAEVRRIGGQVFVTTAEGVTGWVPADRLQPAPDPRRTMKGSRDAGAAAVGAGGWGTDRSDVPETEKPLTGKGFSRGPSKIRTCDLILIRDAL